MAFKDIADKLEYPRIVSQRYRKADALQKFLDGTLYDDAKLLPFDREYTDPRSNYGDYIKLRDRRPSVVSNFARQFVEQTIGLLWMDEQFPIIRIYEADNLDEQLVEQEKKIRQLIEDLALDELMSRATYVGSIGSSAIVVRGLDDGRPWLEVWKGYQCVPVFDRKDPTKLVALGHIYDLTGEDCRLAGYAVADDDLSKKFWIRIDLDAQREQRYLPMRNDLFERLGEEDNGEKIAWKPDQSFPHRLGVVPAIWGRAPNADARAIDGNCVFGAAVDTIVEIDYQLSQIGRAYKYTADPLLAMTRGELNINQYDPSGSRPLKNTTDGQGNVVMDATKTVDVPPGGKAELLEIEGSGLEAALNYVTKLREFALEAIGGMKSDSETQKGAQSGKALELLYQALVIVIKRLRLAWGNRVLLPLLDLLLLGVETGEWKIAGVDGLNREAIVMRLNWPQWMTPTGADFLATVQGWQLLAGGSMQAPVPIFDRENVTRLAATNLGFPDAESLIKAIEEQTDADQATDLENQEASLKLQAQHAPKEQGAQ